MKHLLIIAALGCPLFLMGCYSYETMKPGNEQTLLDSNDAAIQITTIDRSVIEVQSGHYIFVLEPADLIYATGVAWPSNSSKPVAFCGKMRSDHWRKDTTNWLDENQLPRSEPSYCFTSESGIPVRASEQNVLVVKKSEGTGIWCSGAVILGSDGGSSFQGRIPFERIKKIERSEFSYSKTILLGIGAGLTVAGIVAAAIASKEHRLGIGMGLSN